MSDNDLGGTPPINTAVGFAEIKGHLQRLEESFSTMAKDIHKIKEAVYNPDYGIYSRLKDVEIKVKDHEKIVQIENKVEKLTAWKDSVARIVWTAFTGVIVSTGLTVWNFIKAH
jgi:cell fate (sporulation/competence/biofilm development) regulator YlbF (YheA/YmcA/DUF963 family)